MNIIGGISALGYPSRANELKITTSNPEINNWNTDDTPASRSFGKQASKPCYPCANIQDALMRLPWLSPPQLISVTQKIQ
jgi:hypothetical protein